MVLEELWKEVFDHLVLTASEPVPLTGTDLDIGEEFDVTFTIANTFKTPSPLGHANFINCRLILSRTHWAEPTGPNVECYNDTKYVAVPVGTDAYGPDDRVSYVGQVNTPVSSQVAMNSSWETTIRFKALRKIPVNTSGAGVVDRSEAYAFATLEADFDLARYLSTEHHEFLYTQIDDG